MAGRKAKTDNPSSIRLSDEGKRLQIELAKKLGVSQKAVIELALRALARQEGILH